MTSGVYKLTFSSGSTYIGKSINIENRWNQHAEKFRKGTAAKLMQAEYSSYGQPDGEVLFGCHEDHIDIVEACLINRLHPTLNGTYPKDPFIGIAGEAFDNILSLLNMSTAQHIAKIYEFDAGQTANHKEIETLKSTLSKRTQQVTQLSEARTKETLEKDISHTIASQKLTITQLNYTVSMLEAECQSLSRELAYATLPWWKKLFS